MKQLSGKIETNNDTQPIAPDTVSMVEVDEIEENDCTNVEIDQYIQIV